MSQYLLGVETQSPRSESPAQHPIFNHAIECTCVLSELYIYAPYKSHDDATLSYMQGTLHRFHTLKDVLLLGRAGKMVKAKANAQRMELVKKWNVHEETDTETWTLSKKRHNMNTWRNYVSHERDVSKELDDDFNFLKIHLMFHWVEQISRYWALHQYSADRHEQSHKMNLKDSWNASNHNLNYLPEVLTFQHHILYFEIRELNLQALTQRQANSTATCKSSLPVLIWLHPWATSHMRSMNSWDPKNAVMQSILTLWSKTSEHYSTMHKAKLTAWQNTPAQGGGCQT